MTRTPETPKSLSTAARTRAELDELDDVLDAVIAEGERKLTGEGRIRDEKKEQCRIKWANAVVRAAKARRQVIENRDLVEMHEEIEQLKQQQGWRS